MIKEESIAVFTVSFCEKGKCKTVYCDCLSDDLLEQKACEVGTHFKFQLPQNGTNNDYEKTEIRMWYDRDIQ